MIISLTQSVSQALKSLNKFFHAVIIHAER